MTSRHRLHQDYVSTVAGMRASAKEERVTQLQRICRMYLLYMEDLQRRLPGEAFQVESKNLLRSFLHGCFDDHLQDQVHGALLKVWTVSACSDFECILLTHTHTRARAQPLFRGAPSF